MQDRIELIIVGVTLAAAFIATIGLNVAAFETTVGGSTGGLIALYAIMSGVDLLWIYGTWNIVRLLDLRSRLARLRDRLARYLRKRK